jgi:hypothetical protein
MNSLSRSFRNMALPCFWKAPAGAKPCEAVGRAFRAKRRPGSSKNIRPPWPVTATWAAPSWPARTCGRRQSSPSLAASSNGPLGVRLPTHCPGSPASPLPPAGSPPNAAGALLLLPRFGLPRRSPMRAGRPHHGLRCGTDTGPLPNGVSDRHESSFFGFRRRRATSSASKARVIRPIISESVTV